MEETNKYTPQIKTRQISQLEKEKSTQKLAEKIDKGLHVHSMPNNFKSGKFDYSIHPGDAGKPVVKKGKKIKQKKQGQPHQHKKTGFLILIIGVIFLGALGYGAYVFLFSNQSVDVVVNEPAKQQVQEVPVVESTELEVVIPAAPTIEEELDRAATSTDPLDLATSTDDFLIPEETATSTEPIFVVDTDEDGLTDVEENLLGTNINLVDSDSDSYDDRSEVLSLYNPAGSNLLLDNPAIDLYLNTSYNYEAMYPKAWDVKVIEGGSSVMFMNDSEGFFQISVDPNVENFSIKDWYIKEFALEELPVNQYYVDDDRELVFSPDGFLVYLTDSNNQRIFTLSYVSLSAEPVYFQIFSALVQSFKLL